MADIKDVAICDISPAVLSRALASLETSALRSMDAMHISSVVVLKADVFVSADQRQPDAAAQADLRVEAARSSTGQGHAGRWRDLDVQTSANHFEQCFGGGKLHRSDRVNN